MKRSLTAGLAAIALLMGVTSTASAIVYNGTKYGQYTYTADSYISIRDNAPDNKFPAVNYKYDGGTKQAGLSNKHGYGATVSKEAPSKITAIQPCISRSGLLPMNCGGWMY